ncbi:MAG TPA: motility-associated protein [Limnobacter sp.]|uniref:motility-associated protein n=1 Tax=Limnobacter sp. TaxID=2003368 RepID=UPI002ED7A510
MKILISFIVATLSIFGGYMLAGGQLYLLLQPAEYLIIVGGAAAAFYLGTSQKSLTILKGVLKKSMQPEMQTDEYMDVMGVMHDVLAKLSREGMIAIEADIERPESSNLFGRYPSVVRDPQTLNFITDYLRMMVTSKMSGQQIQSAMDDEITARRKENDKAAGAIYKTADALPAFGIMAAVMGVVHVMGSVGQVSNAELGVMIGSALVGTFIGVLIAYAYVGPLGQFVESRLADQVKKLECIQAILVAHIGYGFSPALSVEFGRKTLFSGVRPSYDDMEMRIKELRNAGTGSGGAAGASATNIFQAR